MFDFVSLWAMLVTFVTARLFPAAVIAAIGILVIRAVLKLAAAILEKSKLDAVAHGLILKSARVVLYILLGLMVASRLGIDVSAVVALASVLTLAVSLSIQDLLSNLISGFTLLYTKPFAANDFVEIAGQSGTVHEIGLTYTKLITPDSKTVSIPNAAVTAAQIVNYTVTGKRRVDINVGVSYDMEPDAVIAALKDAAKVPTILDDPAPFAAVVRYDANTVEYLLQVWCTADDFWTTKFNINRNIKTVFEEQHIAFSFPHVVVHTEK